MDDVRVAHFLKMFINVGSHVYVGFMALITNTLVLCARSGDSLLSVSVRREHAVFSTAGFTGGRRPCPKARETAALRSGIKKDVGSQNNVVTDTTIHKVKISHVTQLIATDYNSHCGGFTCLGARLSPVLKSSSREYDVYPTH